MAIKHKDVKVLIIDMDLRRASLSKVVGNYAPGVSDYLSEATDDIRKLIRPTSQEGLYMIPVGTVPPQSHRAPLLDPYAGDARQAA